jgi:hypothetical protein
MDEENRIGEDGDQSISLVRECGSGPALNRLWSFDCAMIAPIAPFQSCF